MGITKKEGFSENQNNIASLTKALGHPARIAIIEYLLRVNSCVCGDIVNELPLAQATVSHHLKELKNAGVIIGCVEGTSVCYCINEKAIEEIQEYFKTLSKQFISKKTSAANPFSFFNPFLLK